MMARARTADYFSMSNQSIELEAAQERIAQLETLNAQLQSMLTEGTPPTEQQTLNVPIDQIDRYPEQVRQWFDPTEQEKLTQLIQQVGFIGRIWVRRLSSDRYQLIAGERRLRSAISAGLTHIPVEVLDVDDETALMLSLLENLNRVDLNPVEETEGMLRLLASRLNYEVSEVKSLLYRMKNHYERGEEATPSEAEAFAMITKIFDMVGRVNWQSFITMRLRLLNLPSEILAALQQGKLEYTKATVIARIKDEDSRIQLLNDSIAFNLSLSEIKDRVRALRPEKPISLRDELKQIVKVFPKQLNDPRKARRIQKLVEELRVAIAE
uniref:ParB-like partition protein n=1 Tax=Cyanothece sp. (strain PCC 7425 / ATCC 29141) TaxID=395961 RepID=B8HZ34_CYAP4